ncbi:MAG: DUF4271 domain-containing protein [Bacteroidaceae bacterium]|nr:DUF4271 domain-containing protein [Bacteroidaceae bacterium]
MDNPMIQAFERWTSQPFAPVNDDIFIIVLLFAGLLLVIAITDKNCYLRQLFAGYSLGHSRRFSDEVRSSRSIYIRILLIVQACISFSLCLANVLYATGIISSHADLLNMLLWSAVGAITWLLIKTILFNIINAILFTPAQTLAWNQVFTDTFIISGIALYPFAVVGTFFNLSASTHSIIALTMAAVAETWLSVKAFHIFFVKKYGGLQLLLYLCTLEWIPLLVIGKFFVQKGL